MRNTPRLLAAIVAVALCACGGDTSEAGVPAWLVGTAPDVSIGVVEGDDPYLFESIVAAGWLPDGGIFVADAGASAIRVFDDSGRFATEMGRPGEGPGEFSYLQLAWVAGDTLVAYDADIRRLTWFTPSGVPARTLRLEIDAEASGVGRLDAGIGPVQPGGVAVLSLMGGSGGGGDRMSIELFDAEGAHVQRLGEVSGMVRFEFGEGSGAPLPFSPLPRFAVQGPRVFSLDGYANHVRVMEAAEGTRTLSTPRVDHDIPAAWSGLEQALQDTEVGLFLEALPHVPRPDSLPQIAALLPDDEGQLWVKAYEPMEDALWLDPFQNDGGTWNVLTLDGDLVATVSVPLGFRPLQVLGDRVLGRSVDELGVQRVEVRPLER